MKRQARAESWVVHGWVANLEHVPLPRERFDLVVVTNYLQRDLWPSLLAAVTPGGFLLYETFTVAQRALPGGPRSAHHLLGIGELAGSVPGWSIEEDVEVESPLAQARLVARKPDGREQGPGAGEPGPGPRDQSLGSGLRARAQGSGAGLELGACWSRSTSARSLSKSSGGSVDLPNDGPPFVVSPWKSEPPLSARS